MGHSELASVEQSFEATPESLHDVRALTRSVLPSVDRSSEDVVLITSELASNVVRHAHTQYTVSISVDDRHVRVEVSDGSSIIPAVEDLSDSQYGLRMVERITSDWGVEATNDGKTVWAEFTRSTA